MIFYIFYYKQISYFPFCFELPSPLCSHVNLSLNVLCHRFIWYHVGQQRMRVFHIMHKSILCIGEGRGHPPITMGLFGEGPTSFSSPFFNPTGTIEGFYKPLRKIMVNITVEGGVAKA